MTFILTSTLQTLVGLAGLICIFAVTTSIVTFFFDK